MPLTQEDAKRSRGMDQMTVTIEKMRAEMRCENRKSLVSLVAGFGTAFAGGAASLGPILHLAGKL